MSDPPSSTPHRLLAALLVVCCAKAVLRALVCPPCTGHDEVAHYEYIRVLSAEGRPPSLLIDRLPDDLFAYHDFALQWDATNRFAAPLYTALHPPLYYALMVPIYRATRRATPEVRQLAVRLASIPFGLMTVLLASAWRSCCFHVIPSSPPARRRWSRSSRRSPTRRPWSTRQAGQQPSVERNQLPPELPPRLAPAVRGEPSAQEQLYGRRILARQRPRSPCRRETSAPATGPTSEKPEGN